MTTKTLKIHTENLLPIIKKWLYSDKEIFVRELVSNACDAIQKCKVLTSHGLFSGEDSFRIDITVDKKAKTLTFADNGIGMTAEEVEKYIAQIAFSGAEEFLSTYKSQEQIIGHFGLGFFSAYMVASKVTLETLSYQEGSTPVFWSCDGTASYEIAQGERKKRGTSITLYIDQESEEFLEEAHLRTTLTKYCAFLPVPIYLNESKVNEDEPLWLKNPSTCTKQDYLQFYHTLYPFQEDPIFWIHIHIDYPLHMQGILYFPKVHQGFNFQDKSLRLFCNRVFVSDNCKDLLPDYLTILRGAIDSADLPLNVSRSALQKDHTVRSLAQHISKKVCDRLGNLYATEKDHFFSIWHDMEPIVKLGILQDEKFAERAKPFLVWKNAKEEWTTLEEYLERHRSDYKGKIYYTTHFESTPMLQLYLDKGIEVLQAGALLDPPLFNVLEQKESGISFQRIDGGLDPQLLDASREKSFLDAEGRSEAAKIAEFIRSQLDINDLAIEAKSLASDEVPACIVMDERMRRMRDTLQLTQRSTTDFPHKQTFIVNTNHKLIQALPSLATKNASLAKDLVQHLYDLSLLSQKEYPPSQLATFSIRAHKILTRVAEALAMSTLS